MAVPSLAEITSIKGDAQIGAAGEGLNLTEEKIDASLPYLQAAATAVNAADRMAIEQYNKNLETSLKRIHEMDFKDLMPQDFTELSQGYASLLKGVSQSYDVMRNPQKNLQKWGELSGQEAALRTKLAQSQGSKAIYDESQKFLSANSAWNTPANQQKLQEFMARPLDQREPFQFDAPFSADFSKLAEVANKASTVTVADSQVVPGGRYIRTSEGTTIDAEKFKQVIAASLNGKDEFSRSSRQGYQQLYEALPEQEKNKYSDLDDFVLTNTMAYKNLPQHTKNKLDENQIWITGSNQAHASKLAADSRVFEEKMAKLNRDWEQTKAEMTIGAKKGGTVNPKTAGVEKNQLLANLFITGQIAPKFAQQIYGNDAEIEVETDIWGDDPEGPYQNGESAKIKTGRTKIKKPLIEVESAGLQNGKLLILRKNNQTGQMMEPMLVSLEQANSDFNLIAGEKNMTAVAAASREFLKKTIGTEEFDLEKIKAAGLFGFSTNAVPGVEPGHPNPWTTNAAPPVRFVSPEAAGSRDTTYKGSTTTRTYGGGSTAPAATAAAPAPVKAAPVANGDLLEVKTAPRVKPNPASSTYKGRKFTWGNDGKPVSMDSLTRRHNDEEIADAIKKGMIVEAKGAAVAPLKIDSASSPYRGRRFTLNGKPVDNKDLLNAYTTEEIARYLKEGKIAEDKRQTGKTVEKTKEITPEKGGKTADSPYKNSKFMKDGKPLDTKVLTGSYSAKEIAEFIKLGLIKEVK